MASQNIKSCYACPIEGCTEKFRRSLRLEEHAKEVHGVRLEMNELSVSCPSCGKLYRDISLCRRHAKGCTSPAVSQSSQDTVVVGSQAIEKELDILRQKLNSVTREVCTLRMETQKTNAYAQKLCEQLKRDRVRLWVFQQQL